MHRRVIVVSWLLMAMLASLARAQANAPRSFDIAIGQVAKFPVLVGAPGTVTMQLQVHFQQRGDAVDVLLLRPDGRVAASHPRATGNVALNYVATPADMSLNHTWTVQLQPQFGGEGRVDGYRAQGSVSVTAPQGPWGTLKGRDSGAMQAL